MTQRKTDAFGHLEPLPDAEVDRRIDALIRAGLPVTFSAIDPEGARSFCRRGYDLTMVDVSFAALVKLLERRARQRQQQVAAN